MPREYRRSEQTIRKLLSPHSPLKAETKQRLRDGILRGTVKVKRTQQWPQSNNAKS